MITVQCACGRVLKVKDESAGKRIRCPDCSEPVRIPYEELEDEDFDDMEDDDSPSERRQSQTRSKKSTSKTSSRKKRRDPGSGITAKKIFGFLSLALGSVLLVGIVIFIFSGEFQPKRLGGLVVPFAMIGMGWAWMKGETYGG